MQAPACEYGHCPCICWCTCMCMLIGMSWRSALARAFTHIASASALAILFVSWGLLSQHSPSGRCWPSSCQRPLSDVRSCAVRIKHCCDVSAMRLTAVNLHCYCRCCCCSIVSYIFPSSPSAETGHHLHNTDYCLLGIIV